MKLWSISLQAGMWMATALSASGCSLILDWPTEGLDCDKQKPASERCLEGYSCLSDKCVADGSLGLNETCSDDVQCADIKPTICGTRPSTCREACSSYYSSASCQGGQFCRPEQSRDDTEAWIGTCINSECTTNESCRSVSDASRQCVAVTASSKTCLATCEVSVTPKAGAAPAVADTCGSAQSTQLYCQPIGPNDDLSLVCLQRLEANDAYAPSYGAPCLLVENACKKGLACYNRGSGTSGFCRRYCDPRQTTSEVNPACVDNAGAALAPTHYCCKILAADHPSYNKVGLCLPESCQ